MEKPKNAMEILLESPGRIDVPKKLVSELGFVAATIYVLLEKDCKEWKSYRDIKKDLIYFINENTKKYFDILIEHGFLETKLIGIPALKFFKICNFTEEERLSKFKNGDFKIIKTTHSRNDIPDISKSADIARYGGNHKLVLKRDSYKCSICDSRKKLIVHHLLGYEKGNDFNNRIENLITLCETCHKKVHSEMRKKVLNS